MKIKRITPNIERSNSLLKTSNKTLEFANKNKINKDNSGILLANYYESLIEILHSYAFKKGFKIPDHINFTEFISKELGSKEQSIIFDRARRLRNGLIYYGKDLPIEVAVNGINEIKALIRFVKGKL